MFRSFYIWIPFCFLTVNITKYKSIANNEYLRFICGDLIKQYSFIDVGVDCIVICKVAG